MVMEEEQKIFKKSSTTYYFSSRFFPRRVRYDVYRLYSFVRTADNYVDEEPRQPKKLLALEKAYLKAVNDPAFDATAHKWDDIDARAVKNIVRLLHKYKFDPDWVKAFFDSMKADIDTKTYKTLDRSLAYVYGSAEVVGLMMAKVLKLPEEAYEAAKLQGRAMQWINFIRDIKGDGELGRCYFPQSELKEYGLKDLSHETAKANPEKFKRFVQAQIDRYRSWQREANLGLSYIPERLQVPIKTAIDMYAWTARKIEKNPFIVFETKVKPRKRQVLRQVLKNTTQGTARATVKASKKAKSGVNKIRPAAKAAVPAVKQAPRRIRQKTREVKNRFFEE